MENDIDNSNYDDVLNNYIKENSVNQNSVNQNIEQLRYIERIKYILSQAKLDEAELITAGQPQGYIERLSLRTDVYAIAESEVVMLRECKFQISNEWDIKLNQLSSLKLNVLSNLEYCFDICKITRNELNGILDDNNCFEDEITLARLVYLAKQKKAELNEILFDFNQLEQAELVLEEVQAMHCITIDNTEDYEISKIRRNKAYRNILQGIENIQNYAKLAFSSAAPKRLIKYAVSNDEE